MDIRLIIELGLRGQLYTLPVFVAGVVLLVVWRAATWRRRAHRWMVELGWMVAVLGYLAVTATPTVELGELPISMLRHPILWGGWGAPVIGLVAPSAEVLLNSWLLVPAGLFAVLVGRSGRAACMLITVALPFLVELGIQPFDFMGRAVTTPDLFNNLGGAVVGMVAGVVVERWLCATSRSSRSPVAPASY